MEHYKNLDLADIKYFCEYDLIWKTEMWKPVYGYEGIYSVSDLGRVKGDLRVTININGRDKYRQEKIKKQSVTKLGYLMLRFSKNNIPKSYLIHRLVGMAFVKNENNKSEINHKNGIKTDNRASELEWNTRTENINHSWANKLSKPCSGEKSGMSKLTEKQVFEIRAIGTSIPKSKIASIYNVCESTIYYILKRKTWGHLPIHNTR